MKYLFTPTYRRIRNCYLYPEIKQFSQLITTIALIYICCNYGKLLLSEQGCLWSAIIMLTVVLSLAIRIYYRIIVIKYHEKDIHIKLFENLNSI